MRVFAIISPSLRGEGGHADEQRLHDFRPHTGVAAAEAVGFEQQDQAYRRFVEWISDTGRMARHEISLQLRQLIGRNTRARQLSKACVQAIDGFPTTGGGG